MSVAVVLNDEKHASQILPWATRFARASDLPLMAIIVTRSKASGKWSQVDWAKPEGSTELAIQGQLESLGLAPVDTDEAKPSGNQERDPSGSANESTNKSTDGHSRPLVPFKASRFQALDPVTSLSESIASLKIDLLIVPHSIDASRDAESSNWHDTLYRHAPCRTIFLHDDQVRPTDKLRVLTVVTDDQDDRAALLAGYYLAGAEGGTLTAVRFETAIDQWATQLGDRILERIVHTELGRGHKNVRQNTILANSVVEGVRGLPAADYDLILIGSRQRREIEHVIDAVPRGENGDAPAIAAVRNKVPLPNRIIGQLQSIVQRYVPQLSRKQRIDLFENVHASSQWNFDFVAMTCLSTLIAALGLVDDSVPVVIGAMLVAPLMTPIIAIGLGLAQENVMLIRSSVKTVWNGFATAFLIGFLTGLCAFTFAADPEVTNEMASRNLPGIVDLLVALASGVAAAYAMGRPNLMSAIPGVAIAAALVPPLATSGLALALGNWGLAAGSTLLFLTNMVAIVLAGSIVFWFVGVRPDVTDKKLNHWPRWVMLGLILATLLLTVFFESYHLLGW